MHIIISAQEMARLEEEAISDGCSREAFMQEAGCKIAKIVQTFAGHSKKTILLLVGKGNKGGDALACGSFLLQKGFSVDAFTLYPAAESSALNQKMRFNFLEKGGRILSTDIEISPYSVIVDGILGTGFKGSLPNDLKEFIHKVNQIPLARIAIDLPSGLDGSTGKGAEEAVRATATVALGAAKSGCFLQNGWNVTGKLYVEDFGLPVSYLKKAKIFAHLVEPSMLKLPSLIRNRHKYQAGFVLGFGGSKQFSGAPKLSSLAALRSGAGIVKLFYPQEAENCMHPSFLELVHAPWDETAWMKELAKATSLFIGPGLGMNVEVQKWLKKHLSSIKKPCVLDADALAIDPSCFPAQCVLTPHRGEALRLLGVQGKNISDEELLVLAQAFSDQRKVVFVLKGAPTFVLIPEKKPFVIPYGDPGMATAGSGDVLTGVIAAFLAQGLSCSDAAVLGATLHALAGERAAKKKGSYAMIASDLIEELADPLLWQLFSV